MYMNFLQHILDCKYFYKIFYKFNIVLEIKHIIYIYIYLLFKYIYYFNNYF